MIGRVCWLVRRFVSSLTSRSCGNDKLGASAQRASGVTGAREGCSHKLIYRYIGKNIGLSGESHAVYGEYMEGGCGRLAEVVHFFLVANLRLPSIHISTH